jgi:lipid-binding SYLF domain-containing protein
MLEGIDVAYGPGKKRGVGSCATGASWAVQMFERTRDGFHNSVAASYGLQAGVQVFGYALFFMNDSALSYLDRSDGWELGVGPSIVVVDEGVGKSLTSTTITQDVYAFIFDQKGLMGGIGVQGSKITKISK